MAEGKVRARTRPPPLPHQVQSRKEARRKELKGAFVWLLVGAAITAAAYFGLFFLWLVLRGMHYTG